MTVVDGSQPSYAPDDPAAWFPPGLDPSTGQAIAEDWWATDPHLAAALAWEAYAATLPPSPSVGQVNTGTQTVTYDPASPVGDYGAAMQRAEWHRSLAVNGGPTYALELCSPSAASNQWPGLYGDPALNPTGAFPDALGLYDPAAYAGEPVDDHGEWQRVGGPRP